MQHLSSDTCPTSAAPPFTTCLGSSLTTGAQPQRARQHSRRTGNRRAGGSCKQGSGSHHGAHEQAAREQRRLCTRMPSRASLSSLDAVGGFSSLIASASRSMDALAAWLSLPRCAASTASRTCKQACVAQARIAAVARACRGTQHGRMHVTARGHTAWQHLVVDRLGLHLTLYCALCGSHDCSSCCVRILQAPKPPW